MPRKYRTQMEIENVMKDLDAENYDDSDSDCEEELENSILEDNSEVDLDISRFFVERCRKFIFMERFLVEETNRYASDILNIHGETSDKRKHVPAWKPTDNIEILKFLGLVLLMGHIEKTAYRIIGQLMIYETPVSEKLCIVIVS
ncbi:hypothetical protein AVEN_124498-1 [Araneus ventricosus]|uniref:PiggyBac transposable element-derived protein domain-containing protein n=1 Tax=Araneus ventricosus TaxID=182803 RepID=A0A4Y2KS92_ARAVE|nr:hypothetical protein AVEN_124498-1 [Araneus ventricosus]